ncbi:hypothetical protein NLI96_g7523 [Meripilus lineatus]|uniref:Uncharacterized protein n=1 Tax=Meripilus lineatus TaxID=2056292 RepID=A0AAD5UZ54_9APHY|nr:hypothetical protein NLI96_g7523 [Physisporinus lineatus]
MQSQNSILQGIHVARAPSQVGSGVPSSNASRNEGLPVLNGQKIMSAKHSIPFNHFWKGGYLDTLVAFGAFHDVVADATLDLYVQTFRRDGGKLDNGGSRCPTTSVVDVEIII